MPGRFLVGVSVFVVHARKVLLLRRSGERHQGAGTWEPVSGRLEEGETPVEAAAREVLEETGLEVGGLVPFHTFTLERGPSREELIGICFAGTVDSADVRLSPEHTRVRWVPIRDLRDAPLPRAVKPSAVAFHARWGPDGPGAGGDGPAR